MASGWILYFLLLGRNAIACGAYTTALLFLELAAEHSGSQMDKASGTEQILFDIYSHIDEPDGFYGSKHRISVISGQTLSSRKTVDKAFRFHGAALEAGSAIQLKLRVFSSRCIHSALITWP